MSPCSVAEVRETAVVSGVDTVRGINYQHCHALLAALDVVADPSLAGIRVEGTDDILDLEIHSGSHTQDAGTVVSRGLQMKTRLKPYTWARSELVAIVRRWARCTISATSEFTLLTDGELSPTGLAVAEALEAARSGNAVPVAGLLGISATDPLCAVAARMSIVSEPGTVEALYLAAVREVRSRLTRGPFHPDAEQAATDRVNELFVLVSKRSGLADPDQRMISREELQNVLGGVSLLAAADRWADCLRTEYVAKAAVEGVDSAVTPFLRTGQTDDRITIGELADIRGPILLTGHTGSGKSTVVKLWRVVSAAEAGGSLVVCQAEAYMPQGLDRAVSDGVGDLVGRDLPRAVGSQVLGDPQATVVIDGVSEIPSRFRDELAKELRNHLAGGHGARVVLVGRDESVCANALPSTASSTRLHPHSFGPAERLELASNVLSNWMSSSESRVPGMAHREEDPHQLVAKSDPPAHECRVALAQVEHALGDASGNPMLLRMALELVAGGTAFTDRASLYELTVDRMAARSNVAAVRLASAALGIVFAQLLDEGRRYANPLEWERLLSQAIGHLEARGALTVADGVRESLMRSGLVNAAVEGIGRTQLLAPVHDSFADYFAARAHADGLVVLPSTLVENDENRLLLSAQMKMLSNEECLKVAAQAPFALVRMSESDHRPLDDRSPDLVSALLGTVLPDGDPCHVTMWRDQDRATAQITTSFTGWITLAQAPDLFAGVSTIAEPTDGPVTIAVRLWRLVLRQRLLSQKRLPPRSPQSGQEACLQLAAHAAETAVALEHIIGAVAPRCAAQRLRQTVGLSGMTGTVCEDSIGGIYPHGWSVNYRQSATTNLVTADSDVYPAEDDINKYNSTADVRSLLSASPEQTASKRIAGAINELAHSRWL